MKVLLLYPRFPKTFWSYDRFMEMANLKAFIPPLGIITIAALLPEDWEIRFQDRNVEPTAETDWEWCDLVILSAMIVQKEDFHYLIRKAIGLGKKVAVGGPYPTSLPEESLNSGAHYLILDEGEITIPTFLEAINRGEEKGVFRTCEKPDVTLSPMPRFDLLKRDQYLMMAIQFSRGCPFNCEFCDIISLYGRKPRTKDIDQTLEELDSLYKLGWRGSIFIVDDNFIGNQRNVKRLLHALIPWMQARNYPFTFVTEASVNLAENSELMELMVKAGFYSVFLGIETPDQDSLKVTQKNQNTRNPLAAACHKINQAGLMIYAGFIIGFDGERAGAGDRIQAFVEQTSIPQPMLGVLQAPPNTALWDRLKQEGRLIEDAGCVETGDQNTLMNFIPTRPRDEIAYEYIHALWQMYEPSAYLKRCLRHCLNITPNPYLQKPIYFPVGKAMQLITKLFWKQGICMGEIRQQFWSQLWHLASKKPQFLSLYLGLCAAGEHFWEYRLLAREKITQEIGYDPLSVAKTDALVTQDDRNLVSAQR